MNEEVEVSSRERDGRNSEEHEFARLTSMSTDDDDVFEERLEEETSEAGNSKVVRALLTRLPRWPMNGGETGAKLKQKVTSAWFNVKYNSRWVSSTYEDYDKGSVIVLLSKFYSLSGRSADRERAFNLFTHDYFSRIWLTYRSGFPPLHKVSLSSSSSSGITSDCGWGCTLRSAQMMMGQAMVGLHLGRDWRWEVEEKEEELEREETIHREIISLFLDSPSSPFSLHSLLQEERERAGKWFSPSQAFHLIKRVLSRSSSPLTSGIELEIVVDGAVDLSELESKTANWTRRLILVVCVRMGLNEMNQVYSTHIRHLLQSSSSLGIVGGQKNRSVYFIGYTGEEVIFLDPHVSHSSLVSLPSPSSPSDISSFHCSLRSKFSLSSMDPSCAIGFIFNNQMELIDTVRHLNKAGVVDLEEGEGVSRRNEFPLFTVFTTRPPRRDSIEMSQEDRDIAERNDFNLL